MDDATIDYRGYSIEIVQDESAENPREDRDTLGTLHSWSRQISGDVDHSDYTEPGEIIAELAPGSVTLPLYLYDYGSGGSGIYVSDLDSANGFITVSAERIREEYKCKRITAKTRAQVESTLRAEIKELSQYFNGEAYGYIIRGPGIDVQDSVWGFFGYDYCLTSAKQVADYYANELEAQSEALDFALARV